MTGYCSSCRRRGIVRHYRMAEVGLRYLHPACRERLTNMGMAIALVTPDDPRHADHGRGFRRRLGLGRRAA